MDDVFLAKLPVKDVMGRLEAAGGNEVASGKLASQESSAALAVNTFSWFVSDPSRSKRSPVRIMRAPHGRLKLSTARASDGQVDAILGSTRR